MALSESEAEYLEGLLQAVESAHVNQLSDWRRGFMKDQRERWEKYGPDIFLSPKQWNILRQVAEDVGYEAPG